MYFKGETPAKVVAKMENDRKFGKEVLIDNVSVSIATFLP